MKLTEDARTGHDGRNDSRRHSSFILSPLQRLMENRSRTFLGDGMTMCETGPAVICRSRDGLSFDRPLGNLSRGDTIYVAISPGETDSDDAFGLDYTIAR